MRKRLINHIGNRVILLFVILFPLFHYFFWGLSAVHEKGLADIQYTYNFTSFMETYYSPCLPFVDRLGIYTNTPVGIVLEGLDNSLGSDITLFTMDSFGFLSFLNYIVYVYLARLFLAVLLFIPKFATKLLNRFSADDEVIL